ncbi:MAG TPA: universal stress protein [Candidatus Manganitrophaceae bacterium]|nr:universal stress protein [Candidatus Manganitrophaceae bacterium]
MALYRKILVPVDFSPCSREAYRVGTEMAKQFGAELWILHVIDSRVIEPLAEASGKRAEELTKELNKKARSQFRSFLSGLPTGPGAHRMIVVGAPFHEIVKTTRKEEVDLIVMGRYGGTGELEKILFGSTAERVVRVAPCAVLSVPLLAGGAKTVEARSQ